MSTDIQFNEIDIDTVKFGMWMERWGWEFYDCDERAIHFPSREVVLITELFKEYKKENPDP